MNQLQQTINSLEIAGMVGRRHDQVLRDINKIMEHLNDHKNVVVNYFIESTYIDSKGEERPCFDCTKKGCELYSTRMTGAKGTQFAVAYIERFNQMEEHIKSTQPKSIGTDQATKRMNAEARLKNANARQAKLLSELARDAKSDVNKVLLQDKAVEVLTGEKLLAMPALGCKFYSANEIAKKKGMYSKTGNPHETAVSQLIQKYISLEEYEFEFFPGSTDNWSGDVTKYAESVLEKVENWLVENNYPTVIQGQSNKYHIVYEL